MSLVFVYIKNAKVAHWDTLSSPSAGHSKVTEILGKLVYIWTSFVGRHIEIGTGSGCSQGRRYDIRILTRMVQFAATSRPRIARWNEGAWATILRVIFDDLARCLLLRWGFLRRCHVSISTTRRGEGGRTLDQKVSSRYTRPANFSLLDSWNHSEKARQTR